MPSRDAGFATVAFYDPAVDDVRFAHVFGLPFGLTASVTQFVRVATLVRACARRLLALLVDLYIDDNLYVDPAASATSAAESLAFLYSLVGIPLKTAKHQPPAPANTALGVLVDISRAHHATAPTASLALLPRRRDDILAALAAAADANYLSPADAATLYGKLHFAVAHAWGRPGRAALQPLIQRSNDRDATHTWTPTLAAMRAFFNALLPHLPPAEIPIREPAEPTTPLLLYTDASWSSAYKGIGIFLADPLRRFAPTFAAAVIPASLLARFPPNALTAIYHAELAAAVSALTTFATYLRNHHVLHFVDNTGALSNLIHGYARDAAAAPLVNAYHLLAARYRIRPFFEYVPSAENIADIPSRPPADWGPLYDTFHAVRHTIVLPPDSIYTHPAALMGDTRGR